MSQQTPNTFSGATLGEQIRMKQLATCPPTQKELKKAGQPAVKPLPPKARGFFFKPPEKRVQVTFLSEEARQQTQAELDRFRSEVGAYMHDRVSQLRVFLTMTAEEQAGYAEQYEALLQEIADTFNQEHPFAKQLALLAYADAVVQDRLDNQPRWEDAKEALADLSTGGKDFLVSAEPARGQRLRTDQVKFGNRIYSLAPGFKNTSEAFQVFEKIGRLVQTAYDEGRQYAEEREQTVTELAGSLETQLTLEELTTGSREGFRYLPTPPQEWTAKFTKDGESKTQPCHRGRGGIAIQAVIAETPKGPKPRVILLDGHGGIERDCQRILDTGVFVTPRSLTSDHFLPPEKLDREKQTAARILHRIIRLGIVQAEESVKREAEKAEFRSACLKDRDERLAKQTVSPADFFAGEAVGDILVEWGLGSFKLRVQQGRNKPPAEKLVWFVNALVGRDEQGRVGVKDCPERLNGFFASHREFKFPGPDFANLGKLGVILRQMRDRVLKGVTPEELEAARQRAVEAETARKAAEVQAQQNLAVNLAAGTDEDLSGVVIPDPTEGRS